MIQHSQCYLMIRFHFAAVAKLFSVLAIFYNASFKVTVAIIEAFWSTVIITIVVAKIFFSHFAIYLLHSAHHLALHIPESNWKKLS